MKDLVFEERTIGKSPYHDRAVFSAYCSCGRTYSVARQFRTAGEYPSSFIEAVNCRACKSSDSVHFVVVDRLDKIRVLTEILTEEIKDIKKAGSLGLGNFVEYPTDTPESLRQRERESS